ncbi:MAG: hypothetical protein K8L99_32180 [Anaerolineae bacterium]|nr:hypothetical protein [Anaerolineae bacterium]
MSEDDRLGALVDLTEAFEEAILDAGADDTAAVWMVYLPLLIDAWQQFKADPELYDLLAEWRYGDLVARFRQGL